MELCILRCIKPDTIDLGMERLVRQVINPDYFDFRKDLLDQFLAERGVFLPGDHTATLSNTGSEFNPKSKKSTKSKLFTPKSIVDPTASLDSQEDPDVQVEFEEAFPKKTKNFGSISQNLSCAFNDSLAKSPILMLLTQTIDAKKLLYDFIKTTGLVGCNVMHFVLFKGQEEKVEAQINGAVDRGDWLLLEGLHLVESWLPFLEELIVRWSLMPEIN